MSKPRPTGPGAPDAYGPETPGVTGPLIAEVAPAAPISGGDGLFDYLVPPRLAGLVQPGSRLIVPLLGRHVEGFCLGLKTRSDVSSSRLKEVASVVDGGPAYPRSSLDLAVWTARRYLCQPGEVLRAAMPPPRRARPGSPSRLKLAVDAEQAAATSARLARSAPVQAAVLAELARAPADPRDLRRRLGPQTAKAVSALEGKGLVVAVAVRSRAKRPHAEPEMAGAGLDPAPGTSPDVRVPGATPLALNPAQEAALSAITQAITEAIAEARVPGAPAAAHRSAPAGRVFLLHGVTGSGKTEVYLRAAAEALARGRQVLLLVPEVSLVPQTLGRVRSHLGSARVAVAHSYLGGRERLEYWEKVVTGQADVVVGARSAVFAPLERLGLIVLDEEHEDSYKQDEGAPRYHARDVAVRRAAGEGAALVLASATPSLETYCQARDGRFHLLELPERAAGRAMPPVEIADMRAELAAGNRSLFSRSLQSALTRTLGSGQQAILFLNRRGHSTFVLCRDCGWVARCPDCDVSLTYHDEGQDLKCHYCGHHSPPPDRCPGCGGHRVRYFGAGTQRVEEEIRLFYPSARVVRLDADVVRQTGETGRVLALFEAGQADVLVGTQMVAKGLDIPGVGLVAAVAADSALHLPDFRAPEKTFRLLTQAAGRAGRGDHPGRVIIQTYNPDHPAVAAATRHDYISFAAAELEARRALGYPPFSRLVRVEFSDPDESRARAAAAGLAEALSRLGFAPSGGAGEAPGGAGEGLAGAGAVSGGPRYGGPAEAPLARLRGRWRWHILVFCPDLEDGLDGVRQAVRETTGREARGGGGRRPGGTVVSVDVDPVSVL